MGLAELALAQCLPADAVPLAERAVRLRELGRAPSAELAEARFLLARALWDAKESRRRALALAGEASGAYREVGAAGKKALADVEAWLREHEQHPPG